MCKNEMIEIEHPLLETVYLRGFGESPEQMNEWLQTI